MKKRQIFNEKGMTLVELLAALGLFTVVIALSSTVIVQLISSEDRTGSSIKNTQDMNVVVNDLKKQFYDEKDKVCINNYNNFLIKESSNGLIDDFQKCIQGIDYTHPLKIKVGTVDSEIEIITTVANKEELEIEVPINNDSKEADDFNEEDYTPWYQSECEINGDTKFEYNIMQSNTSCQPDHKITVKNGSAWFPNDSRIGIHYFEVENNLYSYKQLILESSNKNFTIRGNANFKGNLIVENADLIIEGNATFQRAISLHNKNNSNVTIKGNATFFNEDVFESVKDKIKVKGETFISEDKK